ncbi:site-2 protease family protein [Streptomyces sp. NBC_00557]|uniref:site-2 protease family protein n=1 Tax=Streptomyces sp. NBC_00557 TaxID=2975776 RepID=UPI002E81477E|nr:site-2 protease family protein [Streptomyces sp. NBC_00557]WUC38043.1 site-2 protease family protein [Streptomyces sp. NBC_00557]
MDVSGGSGQPRSGNDKPAEHPAGPTAPTTDPTGPEPQPPTDHHRAETDDTRTDRPGRGDAPPPRQPGTAPGSAGSGAPDATEPGEDTAGLRSDTASAASASPERTDSTDSTGSGTGSDTDASEDRTDAAAPPGPPEGPGTGGAGDAAGAEGHAGRPQPPGTPSRPGHAPGAPRDEQHEHRSLAHSGIAKGEPPQPRPKEPGGGILMGRPFGVPVYVAPSWFLVAALITWVFGGQLDRVLPELGAARYLVSLFFAVAFYASVLVHELAHTVAAIRFKLPVRRIQLQFFGGVSEIEKEAETPGREFVLAFVGPLLSLVLAGLFYVAMKPVEPGTVPGVLLAGLMISNLIVAVFNLLPGLPLDGGRMLRAVVWKITGRPMSGTVAAAWVGRALAVTVLIGLPLLNQSGALGGGSTDTGGMDTVTDALLAAILAAIIWTGAGNSLRMARLREHLPELRARTLTRRAVPVETDTPLSEALRRANAAGARALVVVDAHGTPVSLVRESAIVGVPEHRRPWVAVSGLAQDLTEGMRVSAELAGEELLDVLRATPATEYLVVEETGEIYGVLSAADVERAFVRAMARPAS